VKLGEGKLLPSLEISPCRLVFYVEVEEKNGRFLWAPMGEKFIFVCFLNTVNEVIQLIFIFSEVESPSAFFGMKFALINQDFKTSLK
jgi:hypothetical protein